jgi:hypothetical protein
MDWKILRDKPGAGLLAIDGQGRVYFRDRTQPVAIHAGDIAEIAADASRIGSRHAVAVAANAASPTASAPSPGRLRATCARASARRKSPTESCTFACISYVPPLIRRTVIFKQKVADALPRA